MKKALPTAQVCTVAASTAAWQARKPRCACVSWVVTWNALVQVSSVSVDLNGKGAKLLLVWREREKEPLLVMHSVRELAKA